MLVRRRGIHEFWLIDGHIGPFVAKNSHIGANFLALRVG
jgi:hypothetical protein